MCVQDTEAEGDVQNVTSRAQKIAAELVETERKYVEKLHLVDQVSLQYFAACDETEFSTVR